MQYFIAVVPPKEIARAVLAFKNRWQDNLSGIEVEPHITVKAQGGLTEGVAWLDWVKEVAGRTAPFPVRLIEPNMFQGKVVFLGVESAGIAALHAALVEAVRPESELLEWYFERAGKFVPHMTLAMAGTGLTEASLLEIKQEAEQLVFAPFEADFLRVYRQETEGGPYAAFADIALEGRVVKASDFRGYKSVHSARHY